MHDELELRLLNDYQRDFPLCPQPFGEIGRRIGAREQVVLEMLEKLRNEGKVARVGPVFAPGRLGASTLVALALPPERLGEVATIVSGYAEVNHNYERDHRYNLWFVATAPDEARLRALLTSIATATGQDLLSLPLVEEFHIDLGFPLDELPATRKPQNVARAEVLRPGETDRALLAELQEGLPLSVRPFASIAERIGAGEQDVIARIRRWLDDGAIRRFGVVVRHRSLGFAANAMVVHDIPDAEVGRIGHALAHELAVKLCYRRPRVLPQWPYNLFCMIHGRERASVEEVITRLRERHELEAFPHEVLFSKTCFKQTGARYV